MSSLISAELVATCNSLGYFDLQQNKYHADENSVESVKDLIRYLKRDDDTHEIRRQLGETKVVQTDLLPLLKTYWEQTNLFDVLLRLLVNLTTPSLVLWNEEVPTERTARNHFLQIEEHLQQYKQAFADDTVWAVLSTRISKILEVDSTEREEETGIIIERILILVRNILNVAADPDAEKRPDNDANIHDQVLWTMHQSGMLDIILYVSSANEKAYYMHILEILYFMLREQNGKDLATAALHRSESEKMRDDAELLAARQKENLNRHQKIKSVHNTRHSRFGGTFVVQSMKSISDNQLIYHKPVSKLDQINFDHDKTKVRPHRSRAILKTTPHERRSAFSIRLFLKEFCIEFINGAYNTFMYIVKERLNRQQAQKHDETYYLWAIRFFLEFNRVYCFDVKLISETISVETFQYVLRQMETYCESIASDKKNVYPWTKRLHAGLLAYRELLLTLCAMDKSIEEEIRASSRVIKSNIFYVMEYRELVFHLLIIYNPVIMTKEFLRDVIETQHVFLKMFEAYCSGSTIMVQEKSGRRRTKKKSAPQVESEGIDIELLWTEVSDKLREYLDGTKSVREEMKWKVNARVVEKMSSNALFSDLWTLGVQRLIVAGDTEEAIALMLEARELHPNLIEAPDDIDEQIGVFHKVFFSAGEASIKSKSNAAQEGHYEEDEEDELEEAYKTHESDLKFDDFAKRLAHPNIVRACALALAQFENNNVSTNHCIIKLLHRIAFDLKLPSMLFQVSIFTTFQRIYQMKSLPQNKELVKFAKYIIRQFFIVAQKNRHVFMEALFWKTSKDAAEVMDGYGSYHEKSKAASQAWTEYQEDELRRLFMEHRENNVETDVIDWIVDNLVDNTKNRRGVIKKLKEMYLLVDYKPNKKSRNLPPIEWGEDEEEQLKQLYEDHKGAMDPLGIITSRLAVRRPKNRVKEKLLELGIVHDKKLLRKKRANNANAAAMHTHHDVTDGSDSDESDEDATPRSSGNHHSASTSYVDQSTQGSNKKAEKSSRKASTSNVKVDSQKITKILLCLPNDLHQALDWLMESLQDVADDKENDPNGDDESIALVPIFEHSIAAMENDNFLMLLRACGIQEPRDEQETYWRIPAPLTDGELRLSIDLIQQALEKTLVLDDNENPQETIITSPQENCSVNELTTNFLIEPTSTANVDTDETNLPHTIKQRKRIRIESSSEEEGSVNEGTGDIGDDNSTRIWIGPHASDSGNEQVPSTISQIVAHQVFRSKTFFVESDDEEDIVDRTLPVPNNNSLEVKRVLASTNITDTKIDGDAGSAKRTRSWSESPDAPTPTSQTKSKKRRFLDSDDES